jgi:hypothetical protein
MTQYEQTQQAMELCTERGYTLQGNAGKRQWQVVSRGIIVFAATTLDEVLDWIEQDDDVPDYQAWINNGNTPED